MPVIAGLTTTVRAGRPYYRITQRALRVGRPTDRKEVVNGAGAVISRRGARYITPARKFIIRARSASECIPGDQPCTRWRVGLVFDHLSCQGNNHPGVRTVYLAEDPATCFAEKMFYFQQEALIGLDVYHITHVFPPFQRPFVLREIFFRKDVPDIFESSLANASAMNVYPSLMLNPSQEYEHLKNRRAAIQSNGYQGLRAPSSRVRGSGHMIVLFQDQSKNVQSITPYEVEFRLMTSADPPTPFTNHAVDLLDFTVCEVRAVLAPGLQGTHLALAAYSDWTWVEFNH
jgi:hypothetical protein